MAALAAGRHVDAVGPNGRWFDCVVLGAAGPGPDAALELAVRGLEVSWRLMLPRSSPLTLMRETAVLAFGTRSTVANRDEEKRVAQMAWRDALAPGRHVDAVGPNGRWFDCVVLDAAGPGPDAALELAVRGLEVSWRLMLPRSSPLMRETAMLAFGLNTEIEHNDAVEVLRTPFSRDAARADAVAAVNPDTRTVALQGGPEEIPWDSAAVYFPECCPAALHSAEALAAMRDSQAADEFPIMAPPEVVAGLVAPATERVPP